MGPRPICDGAGKDVRWTGTEARRALYRPVHTGEVYLLGVRERSPSMGTSVNPGIGAGSGGLGGPEAIPMGRYIVPREV